MKNIAEVRAAMEKIMEESCTLACIPLAHGRKGARIKGWILRFGSFSRDSLLHGLQA